MTFMRTVIWRTKLFLAKPHIFLDTAYVYALFNTRDQRHAKAIEWQEKLEADNRPLPAVRSLQSSCFRFLFKNLIRDFFPLMVLQIKNVIAYCIFHFLRIA